MSIFRSYDVRGIYGKDIDEDIMKRVGAAFSKMSTKTVAVAGDMRLSSSSLKEAFINGCDVDVIDCGCVPLGVGMLHALGKYDYAYITGSHLPKEWNGVKFFHKSGIGFREAENKSIEKTFLTIRTKKSAKKIEKVGTRQLLESYKKYAAGKAKAARNMHVVLDCGNGMASIIAKEMFSYAGFSAEAVYDKLDGSFPNRNSDPNEDGLEKLKKKMASADIGIAYDGDGDRMVIIDEKGRKLTPEQVAYLVLLGAGKHAGPVVANVECTRAIDDIARKFGKRVIRVPVGHTFMMEGVEKHKACFGLESAAHYALPYMAPFDDSLIVSIFAASVLSQHNRPLSEIADSVREYPFERVNFECDDSRKFVIVENLRRQFRKEYKDVTTLDGVRVDFPDGWVLVRPSNTSPFVRLTAEAKDAKTLKRLMEKFSGIVRGEISKKQLHA